MYSRGSQTRFVRVLHSDCYLCSRRSGFSPGGAPDRIQLGVLGSLPIWFWPPLHSCNGQSVESPGEFHPQALTEPYVRLAPHTALTVHPPPCAASSSGPIVPAHDAQRRVTSVLPVYDVVSGVCISTSPIARGICRDSVASGKAPICNTDHSNSSNRE